MVHVVAVLMLHVGGVICVGVRYVDLTHIVDENSVEWPGLPDFNFTVLIKQQFDGYW